jgi:quinol monooxygenase YgiN
MNNSDLSLPSPDSDETGPYALVGTARAKSGFADALETRLVSLVGPTRQESGALAYHVHRDRADRDLFVFYEVWSSVETLRAHLAQPYIQAFLRDRQSYLIGDLDIRWLRMGSSYPTRYG